MEELIKKSIIRTRNTLQKVLENVPKEVIETIPEGFNNNIHWQVGHILVAGDTFYNNGQGDFKIEKAYFAPGTKPREWNGDVPSLESLLEKLSKQTEEILKLTDEQLNEKLPKPFLGNETRGDCVAMGAFHEAMHLGQIQILKRLVTNCLK